MTTNERPEPGALIRVPGQDEQAAPVDHPVLGDAELAEALGLSRRVGMLGTAPVHEVIAHSTAFLAPLGDVRTASALIVDLGSGGGVPGLVVARARPDLRVALIERRATRADHLRRLVARLGLDGRVEVLAMDHQAATRRLGREAAAVTARGFGAPPVVLAAATGLLGASGLLIVSEPPDADGDRWPADLCGRYGMTVVGWPDQRVRVLRRE